MPAIIKHYEVNGIETLKFLIDSIIINDGA